MLEAEPYDEEVEERIDHLRLEAERNGYCIAAAASINGYAAACTDYTEVVNEDFDPDPNATIDLARIEHVICARAEDKDKGRAILKAYMIWHTLKTAQAFNRSL